MHNHDIIFDVEHKRIGLVESNCGGVTIVPNITYTSEIVVNTTNNKSITAFGTECQNEIKQYKILTAVVIILSTIIIMALIYGMYKVRRRQNFLWLRFSNEEQRKF
jgi:putative effector of murein hydrolase